MLYTTIQNQGGPLTLSTRSTLSTFFMSSGEPGNEVTDMAFSSHWHLGNKSLGTIWSADILVITLVILVAYYFTQQEALLPACLNLHSPFEKSGYGPD